jgi:type VI secretion system Hcp family effector
LVDWGLCGTVAAANFTENILIMKATTFSILMALVALSFVRPAHPTSFVAYMSITGSKQGQFKGASKGKGREDKGLFQIQAFDLRGEVPVDANKGGATGKRQHNPIVITKETDGSSPLLLQAHYTNETLETVIIETVGRPVSGAGEIVTGTITLTNATISRYTTDKGIESLELNYEQVTSRK